MANIRFGASKLVEAIRSGSLDQIKAALDDGENIEEADIHGFPGLPLRTACFAGRVPVVRLLLDRGANVNAATADGPGAPLKLALRAGHDSVAALLIARQAQIPPGLHIAPAILEHAQSLVETQSPGEPLPVILFDQFLPESASAAPADSGAPEEVRYGQETNIYLMDFTRGNGDWEKVPQASGIFTPREEDD